MLTDLERMMCLILSLGDALTKKEDILSLPTHKQLEFAAQYLLANGVLLPPCKVGDEVWLVFTPKHPANPSDKGKWFMVQDGVQRLLYGSKGISVETWNMGTYAENKIGKHVFFTRKEFRDAVKKGGS